MLESILNYFLYFGTMLALLLVAGFIYIRFTPGNEIAMIREGNTAAAIALAGAMLGYSAVVYSATSHGETLIQAMMWCGISLVVQILAVELIGLVIHDKWKEQIGRGDVAHGIALGSFSLAVGLINAGCLT